MCGGRGAEEGVGVGRVRGVREGEVILGSRMEIQNTFVNHK